MSSVLTPSNGARRLNTGPGEQTDAASPEADRALSGGGASPHLHHTLSPLLELLTVYAPTRRRISR
jgi:hypothetical protein